MTWVIICAALALVGFVIGWTLAEISNAQSERRAFERARERAKWIVRDK